MGSIPGLERSPGGELGNSLQYSCLENPTDRGAWWAIVHRVTKSSDGKSLPPMQETWVRSLGWEDPLEEEMAIHSSILKYPMGRGAWHDAVHGVTKSTHACM